MIKKKIAIAALVVAIIGICGIGAINAYFNDTESSTGNSFTAGTLDLVVNTQDNWAQTVFTATALQPGSAGTSTMTLTNGGSIGGSLTGQISSIVNAGGAHPEPEPLPDNGELANYMMIDVWIDANGNGAIDGSEVAIYHGLLSGATTAWDLGDLAGGATTHVSIAYYIPTSVGNDIMGDTCTFSIGYTLTQN